MNTNISIRRVVLGALLLPLSALPAQVSRQRVDTSFTFDRGGSVNLGLVSGEIRVRTGTGNEIRILATIERGRLETSFSRGLVSIEARSVNNRMGATLYELTVPAGTRVTASSVSGDIIVRGTGSEVEAHSVSGQLTVEDANGVVELESVSGDIMLTKASGRIDLSTVSGEMDLTDVSGDLDAESVSGNLVARRSRLRGLRTETVSGDVSYDGSFANDGDYRLNTHSGDVMLTIPPNGNASLELETWSGNIASDFPLTLQPGQDVGRRNRRMQFNIGSGGGRVSAETFSGNITIRRAPARGTEE
ncbi:MAG: DUF4097 domain-containing protein [Gemmatimonadetes bacterium]|nr:DUF4097 domain-containing protein [Gemmatimonadota bacterium]